MFTVRAYTRVGSGESSSPLLASTLNKPCEIYTDVSASNFLCVVYNYYVTVAVEGVMVTPLNDTSVIILWGILKSDLYIDHYTIAYSPRSQHPEEMASVVPPATSAVIAGLEPGVTYKFQVFATARLDEETVDGERSTPVYCRWQIAYQWGFFCMV